MRFWGLVKSPVGSRGKAPVGGLGDKVRLKLNLCIFAHNILQNGPRKCVFRYIDIVRNKMNKKLS